eukprot:1157094-Pelagomonas_calceolata.AAC.2
MLEAGAGCFEDGRGQQTVINAAVRSMWQGTVKGTKIGDRDEISENLVFLVGLYAYHLKANR